MEQESGLQSFGKACNTNLFKVPKTGNYQIMQNCDTCAYKVSSVLTGMCVSAHTCRCENNCVPVCSSYKPITSSGLLSYPSVTSCLPLSAALPSSTSHLISQSALLQCGYSLFPSAVLLSALFALKL